MVEVTVMEVETIEAGATVVVIIVEVTVMDVVVIAGRIAGDGEVQASPNHPASQLQAYWSLKASHEHVPWPEQVVQPSSLTPGHVETLMAVDGNFAMASLRMAGS
jgi:hypothetical protein